MRLSFFRPWRLPSTLRRWAERDSQEYGGWLLDDYGEARFSAHRLLCLLSECLCGLVLSLVTYVSIESTFLSFSALEFVLRPLSDDMIFTMSSEGRGTFMYTMLCFLPFTLNVATFKTVLLPLFIAPVYIVFTILFPVFHCLIGYASCLRLLNGQRNCDYTARQVQRAIFFAVVVEAVGWFTVLHVFSVEGFDELQLGEQEIGIQDGASALISLFLAPTLIVVRFFMEPMAGLSGSSSSSSSSPPIAQSYDIVAKGESLVGLTGLMIGRTYARTARMYIESVIVFGIGPSVWLYINPDKTPQWIPESISVIVPVVLLYFGIWALLDIVKCMYDTTVALYQEDLRHNTTEDRLIRVL